MSTSKSCDFKELFPKNHKPQLSDLQDYWGAETAMLFQRFAEHLLDNYDLRFGIPLWSEKHGWTYRIGRSGVYLISGIQIAPNGFVVDGISVEDTNGYEVLLGHIKEAYTLNKSGFEARIAEKNLKQAQRSKQQAEREKRELADEIGLTVLE